ncbi:hypothetical protein [Streptomyces griseoaurantiacus]|uniref:hypothetical protein n=1 Tax=Streptomyces griseoaurantiacus TaxID=68213 RepID=UPI0036B1B4B0
MTNRVLHQHLPEDGSWLQFVVPAKEMRSLDLGEFEDRSLLPKLEFDYDENNVSHTDSPDTMSDGSIRLMIHFQNFGVEAETVRVRERAA